MKDVKIHNVYFKSLKDINGDLDIYYFGEIFTISKDENIIDYLDDMDKKFLMEKYDLYTIIDYSLKPFITKEKEVLEKEVKDKIKYNTILFENYGLLTDKCDIWAKKIDTNYKMINSEVSSYSISNDLWFFAMLTDPNLKNICTSSCFITNMDYEAALRFNKLDLKTLDWNEDKFKQLEYFTWLIREAVHYRNVHKLSPLTIHINYENSDADFLEDVNENLLGKDVKRYLMLMLRQSEKHVILKIYKEYSLVKTIKTEKQLKFTYE